MKRPDYRHFKPFCLCSVAALEPNERCPFHGYPPLNVCLACNRFISLGSACKFCGYKDDHEGTDLRNEGLQLEQHRPDH